MTRIESLEIATLGGKDRKYSPDAVIAILDGGTGGGRSPARTTMTAAYSTPSESPTVYYTALNKDGTILTSRRTSGVTLSACGDYVYSQSVVGIDEFVAVWDEGNAAFYVRERVVVDT